MTTNFLWNDKAMIYALEKDIFVLPGYRPINTGIVKGYIIYTYSFDTVKLHFQPKF